MTDEFRIAPGWTIMRDEGTTWDVIMRRPGPYPAYCERCSAGTFLGLHADAESLRQAVREHVAWCTWWRVLGLKIARLFGRRPKPCREVPCPPFEEVSLVVEEQR